MNSDEVERHLSLILREIIAQPEVGRTFPVGMKSFEDQVEQIREWIEDVAEAGLAYELMVALLESYPFKLSGEAAVKLLEIGLVFGYKTERDCDAVFDMRGKS